MREICLPLGVDWSVGSHYFNKYENWMVGREVSKNNVGQVPIWLDLQSDLSG